MKNNTLVLMLFSVVTFLARPGWAQDAGGASGNVNAPIGAILNTYTNTLNTQLQGYDNAAQVQLDKYNSTASQLQDDLSQVRAFGFKCSSFGGELAKAIDSATNTLKNDSDAVNSQVPPLLTSLQNAATSDRAPASVSTGPSCEAPFQAGMLELDGLSANISSTKTNLQSSVGSDIATAQKKLSSHDGTIRGLLSPSERCPQQAMAVYNKAKQDFSNLQMSFMALEASLSGSGSMVVAKRSTLQSQSQACGTVAQQ